LSVDPDHRDGLNNFLMMTGDEAPQEAITQLEKLAVRNPNFSAIPAQMAILFQKAGNMDRAMEQMVRAVSLAPENLTYRYNLAVLLDKQGKRAEAANLYKQLLDAGMRGETIPGNVASIQERLTYLRSNN
jgi:Flp pilus assembly protein TadD